MECNKDEAVKAKELAEKKFEQKDIMGARKFALKAQSLFPTLDGLQPLIVTLNVYIAAERKVNGETDWYGVLDMDPSSDDETLRKQYRKLALTLHPDKNKSVGAEGAFKILSEAWSLLSDKSRKVAYDQKRRSSKVMYDKVFPNRPSKTARKNGHHTSANNGNVNRNMAYPNHHATPGVLPQRTTFWTLCTSCNMQFEYIMFYLNKKIECYRCKGPFVAKEIVPPPTSFQSQSSYHTIPQKNSNYSTHACNGAAQVSATLEDVIKSKTNALKRANVDDNGSYSTMRDEKLKKSKHANHVEKAADQGVWGNKAVTETQKVMIGTKWQDSRRELSLLETRNMLMSKAKTEILKKVYKWKNITFTAMAPNKEVINKENVKTKETVPVSKNPCNDEKSFVDHETQPSESVSMCMTVPDSDFHDFDKDRTENSFGDHQVWAAYDNDDGMPRYYAVVHNVVSRKPFKMRISWLNSKSTAEFGPMNWVGCGFFKTSGDFRVGRYEINKSVNSFSHRVKYKKGARGVIQLYPCKGDIWALYKNWSQDWNELTPDEVIHQYEMVEVLEEYKEDKGVTVIPLVKVDGFRAVFCQHTDREQAKVIPREEMFRFSHQVPACWLTGQESQDIPKGCWELDPAATPTELLQVINKS